MDLKSGYPFWAVKNGLMHAFSSIGEDISCDVVVVGGGITGALIADELARNGHDVVVVEQRDVGWGSTSASTALLQYEIDTHLADLAKTYGEAAAVLAYRACANAIAELQELAADLGDVDFSMQESLYYASSSWHLSAFRKEFALRTQHGFDVEWLDTAALTGRYGIRAPCAMLTSLAARVDPYRMAYRLFIRIVNKGGKVLDRCRVERIDASSRAVRLQMTGGQSVRAKHVVMAAGYASQQWLKQRVARNRSSYAFISDPIDQKTLGFLANTLVWESARPYLYLRTTGDGRLLVGGDDDSVDIPIKRDLRVQSKQRGLMKKVHKLFPDLPIEAAFAWAGTFAETDDGLPFFGAHEQLGPRVLFAMAYGGNGITYSMIGAKLLRCVIERRHHPLAKLFSFERAA